MKEILLFKISFADGGNEEKYNNFQGHISDKWQNWNYKQSDAKAFFNTRSRLPLTYLNPVNDNCVCRIPKPNNRCAFQ